MAEQSDAELAASLRNAQDEVAKCVKELRKRGWRVVCSRKYDRDDRNYDREYDREYYQPEKPYGFRITKDKVVVEDQSL